VTVAPRGDRFAVYLKRFRLVLQGRSCNKIDWFPIVAAISAIRTLRLSWAGLCYEYVHGMKLEYRRGIGNIVTDWLQGEQARAM
jgi:hypothetical protein